MAVPDVHIDLHLVLQRDGCVLMGRRLNTTFAAGQYHVPAGRLEVNETIIGGIVREAREETGIDISVDAIDLAYVMHFRGESDRLSLFFTTDEWKGSIENCEPDKCEGWHWIPTDQLPDDTVPYARQAIADILVGKRVGTFGWLSGNPA
ncbi:MAG: NUDIX hydrolase [Aestuariivirgaceae bacterium]